MSDKIYNPIPIATVISSIALAYFLDRYCPVAEIIPMSLRWTGWLVIITGIVLTILTVSTMLKKRTTLNPGGKPSALVTTGIFSFSRNPIYLSDVIIVAGAGIILGSLSALITPLICFLVLNFIVIPFEEKNLRQLFPTEYEMYSDSVRRWI